MSTISESSRLTKEEVLALLPCECDRFIFHFLTEWGNMHAICIRKCLRTGTWYRLDSETGAPVAMTTARQWASLQGSIWALRLGDAVADRVLPRPRTLDAGNGPETLQCHDLTLDNSSDLAHNNRSSPPNCIFEPDSRLTLRTPPHPTMTTDMPSHPSQSSDSPPAVTTSLSRMGDRDGTCVKQHAHAV